MNKFIKWIKSRISIKVIVTTKDIIDSIDAVEQMSKPYGGMPAQSGSYPIHHIKAKENYNCPKWKVPE